MGVFGILGILRGFFITFTYLGLPFGAIIPDYPGQLSMMFFSNDLFFSGHAAYPFLGFLLFRKKWAKGIMLILTIILSLTVLFMHLHYSIDVFAAFFITYGVYRFGRRLFLKETFLQNKYQNEINLKN